MSAALNTSGASIREFIASVRQSEETMARDFRVMTRINRVSDRAWFAPRILFDSIPATGLTVPQRLHHVMVASLDYSSGPAMSEVMALLCEVAKGIEQTSEANRLLDEMARMYARQNAEVTL